MVSYRLSGKYCPEETIEELSGKYLSRRNCGCKLFVTIMPNYILTAKKYYIHFKMNFPNYYPIRVNYHPISGYQVPLHVYLTSTHSVYIQISKLENYTTILRVKPIIQLAN